jgi:chitinase
MFSLTILSTLLFFISQSFAGFDASAKTNVAVYWGQNSIGTTDGDAQGPLADYREENNGVDIIVIVFVTAINNADGKVQLNLANQLSAEIPPHTPATAEGIKACPDNGKTDLLSIAGAKTYSERGYASKDAAEAGANTIWKMFGPKQTSDTTNRPFDNGVVDGFDFDLEVDKTVFEDRYMGAFITILKSLATAETLFSAAPQCQGENIIDGSITYDMLFVQFYNHPACELSAASPTPSFSQWNDWANGNSTKFFVGLPAGLKAAGTGYVSPDQLATYLKPSDFSNMAGAMLWDASQSWANKDANGMMYHKKVKSALGGSQAASSTQVASATQLLLQLEWPPQPKWRLQ